MKTKSIILLMLLFAVSITQAQLTPSITIPTEIYNYDGSYDPWGQGHLYYPNGGEIRFPEPEMDAMDEVQFYTIYTNPRVFLRRDNNVSLCYAKNDYALTSINGRDTIHRIDIEWQATNTGAALARIDTQQCQQLHYINQTFGVTGRTHVQGGAAIACQSIYNNIDLVYLSNNAGMVMYFIVYPGGNYSDILLHFNGSKSSSIVSNKLVADANWDQFTLQRPKMYQYLVTGTVVTPVTVCNASWANAGSDTYQINNSTPYNTALPLIIQIQQNPAVSIDTPGLCWSTYFGGSQFEFMTKTHTDASDNYYVAGNSNAGNFTYPQAIGVTPINANSVDGAISKFNSSGKLMWSTFVGGSANEDIRDFDFDGNNIVCVGRTSSNSNFPIKNKTGAFNDNSFGGTDPWDGFIFDFGFSGGVFTVNWSTYLGGDGWDDLYGCKFDASGELFIVGASSSSNLTTIAPTGGYNQNFNTAQLNPSTPISTDAIIGKFTSSRSQTWFTFFGTDAIGTNAYTHAADYFYGLTIAGSNVYACGKSGGTNLPSMVNSKFVSGQFDGILANFSTGGVLNASKYTDGNISNYAVKELWGEVYTVGEGNTSMTPANSGLWFYNGTASGSTDACFSIHTSNLSATTTHNSFLGGSGDDGAYDLQFSTNNLMLISGGTTSSDFPVTSLGSMYNVSFAGGVNDNFIAAFQKGTTNITWSSCLGSNFNESMNMPPFINSAFDLANTTIAIDSQNKLRLLGSSTSFNSFPLDDGAGIPFFKANNGGLGNDATITCFDVTDLSAIVGLKDFPNTKFSFGIYPNPTETNLSITNVAFANDDLRYAIYDVSGKKLQTGNLKAADPKNIDVSMLQQGVYIINVSNGKMTYSNKFVKIAD